MKPSIHIDRFYGAYNAFCCLFFNDHAYERALHNSQHSLSLSSLFTLFLFSIRIALLPYAHIFFDFLLLSSEYTTLYLSSSSSFIYIYMTYIE